MVEKEHDFRGAGAVDGCNALSDALIELGLLSGSGVWARFFSDCDSLGAFSEQNRANEVLPRHIVGVIVLVLLQAEDVLFCLFLREREIGVNAIVSTRLCGSVRNGNGAEVRYSFFFEQEEEEQKA